MALAFVVSFLGLPRGRPDQEPVADAAHEPSGETTADPVAPAG
jgi:hypothetical protein